MLSRDDYIRMSLDLDLFFLRIMKEHSFFLEAAFVAKNSNLAQYADSFARQFAALLQEAVRLSNGVLTPAALQAGQYYTQFTVSAEQVTQYLSGVPFDTALTQSEESLQPGAAIGAMPGLEDRVSALNQNAMTALTALIAFKTNLLNDVLSCKLFMNAYPLLIDHILREAVFFYNHLYKLQSGIDTRTEQELVDEEIFWNRIMAEHAKFIRGLLDPTENDLFITADRFGHEFDALIVEAQNAQSNPALLPKATADSLDAAKNIRDFKAAGTSGILMCKIRSMIIPLLGDHVLREANHFIYILQKEGSPS